MSEITDYELMSKALNVIIKKHMPINQLVTSYMLTTAYVRAIYDLRDIVKGEVHYEKGPDTPGAILIRLEPGLTLEAREKLEAIANG